MLYPLIKDGFIKFFEDENIKENMILLKKIEQELNVSFVEGTLEALAALLPIMEKNEDTIEIKGISHDKITETLEYYLVQKYFTYLSSEECCYLTLHLLGSRLQSIDNGVVQYSEDEETRELTKILVSEFKRVACVEFENQIEIERALFAHLRTSMYRYKYGIQLGNLMLEDIKKQYSSLFEITKKASEVLTLHIGVPIPDSEIAYLTLHFGGFLRAMKTKVNTLHIVVVCPNGVSTGNMIKGEIRTLLPNANVVKAVSVNEFERGTWDCDFVISTVPLKTTIPLIVVHPILTDIDRIQILKRSMSKTTFQNKQADVDALFNIMKNYVAKDQYKNVYKDLKKYLESLNQFEQISLKPVMNSLMDFLDVSHIYIEEEKMNWISAIHKACDSLIEEKVITANYCSSIISQLQVYGPYMFITQNVVLAHAKSEDGAIQLACNLVVFKQKVAFAPGREAKIVMVLSAPDSQSHLEVLKNINQIFSIATNADAIFECASAEEIQKKMYEMLNIC